MSVPKFAISRPVTMAMISCVVVLLGVVSLTRLPVDLMPDVSLPSLTVRVGYAGAGPLEVEELITRPIEQAVAAVAGLDQINSTSSEGQSVVRLNFTWGTDLNEAADDVRSRIDRVRGRLPTEAESPVIFKFDATQFPILFLGIDGDYDSVTLREMAETDLAARIERVPGVASININGGLRREIRVELSREKTTALDLPVDRIVNLLRTENQNVPLGEINEGDMTYLLRSPGQFENLEEIRDLVVMTRGGVPVYLRDIAEVRDTTEDARTLVRINGRPGVRMTVTKQSGENTVAVARAVKAEVDRINQQVPGIQLSILNDTSRFIESSIQSVRNMVLVGSFLVVIIITAFLRNWRSTLIVCASIPISIIGTFALLYFGGFTLNIMTFGGLALGVGMIVDASIVVLENTYRHMEMGKDRLTAALHGSEEVWSPILASTLTTVAVFVPLFFLSGVSSILFKQLSMVVIFSLSMSLFVAITLVPVLCSKLLQLPQPVIPGERQSVGSRLFAWSERIFARIDGFYQSLLHRALDHRPTVVAGGAGAFLLALLLLPTVGFELMPQADEGEVRVDVELPVGTRIERTDAALLQVEDMVRDIVPEAVMVITQGGGGGMGGFGGAQSHRGNLDIRLVPRNERTRTNDEIAQALRRELSGLPGMMVRARPSGGNWQLNRLFGGGGEGRLALEIRGHDLEDARRLSEASRALMQGTPGIADVRIGREEGRPELAVRVDRPKAALLGLSVANVASSIRTNVAGTQAAFYRERGNEYPIVVRLREEDREQVRDVDDVLISTPTGQVVQARNLMVVQSQGGPSQIDRKNQQRITRVNAEVEATLSDVVASVNAGLGDLNVPQDFAVGFGAEVEEQAKAFQQLFLLLILGLVLVYAVMASQFESFRDPFIIMFAVPLAGLGAVLALKLTGTALSVQGYIGIIMLTGIVVGNAILLVDYTNTLRRRDGLMLRDAVERAGRARLRPILMTTSTTVLGLLPMSLGLGDGAELQVPLARVVIGGLITSSLITLLFVPTVYSLFEEGLSAFRPKRKTAAA